MGSGKKDLSNFNASALTLAAEGRIKKITDLNSGMYEQLTRDMVGMKSFVNSIRSSSLHRYVEGITEQHERLRFLVEGTIRPSSLLELSETMANVAKPYNDLVKMTNSLRPMAFESFAKAMQKQQIALATMEQTFKPMAQDYSEMMRRVSQPAENLQSMIDSIRPLALEQFAKQMSGSDSSAFLKAMQAIVYEEGLREIYQEDDPSFEELDESELQGIGKEIESVIENPETASQLSSHARKILLWLFIYVILPTILNLSVNVIYDTWISQHKYEVDVKELARHMKSELAPELLARYRLVKGENLRLRGEPSMKSDIISLLPKGTLLQLIDSSQRSWLLVEVEIEDDIMTGWVSRRYTRRLR